MAKKTTSGSGLLAKLGAAGAKAFNNHKTDETEFGGGGNLPPGINNGIAQLTSCKFAKYKDDVSNKALKGQYYFMAMGTVISPDRHEGRRVAGLTTKIGPEPLCETPGRSRESTEDHLAWVLNELRKLGVDTSELEFEDLESTAAALEEAAPHFEFNTWETEANEQYGARTWEKWNGIVDYEASEEEQEDEVEEDSEEEEASEEEDSEEESEEEDVDYKSLARKADKGDEDAQTTLTEAATELGYEEDEIQSAKNWLAVAKMIEAGPKEEEEEEEEESEDEEWSPSKGDVVSYKPIDPKTKKPVKRAVECEIVLINKNGTLTLKNMDDGKTKYQNVDAEDVTPAN